MREPIELNKYGLAVWKHKDNKNLFVQRSYNWCDKVIVLDESGEERLVIDGTQYSTFDFSDWIPVTAEEYKKVKRFYKDIYG